MSKHIIPIAIIIAGVFIGSALYFSRTNSVAPAPTGSDKPKVELAPVTNADHIRGNPDADVIIVEYSDYQCPFCKDFHATMLEVMDTYGKDGRVAWVFRHYPIKSLHELAEPAAIAAECVASLKGNDGFWMYSDALFANSPDSLTSANLRATAVAQGVDETAYNRCLESGDGERAMREDLTDGNRIAEANPTEFGTPYNILIAKDGTQIPVAGAISADAMEAYIETILNSTRQ